MNWGVGNMGSKTLSELNWDFSKMSSTTIFSIALLAVLVILLVVLVIVTIKVLSKGKKEDDEEYTERKYTSHDDTDEEDEDEDEDDEEEEPSDSGKKSKKDKKKEKKDKKNKKSKAPEVVETGEGEDDEDEDEEKQEETSAPIREERTDSKDEVAAVVEAALQAKAKAAELEARVAMEKAEQARAEAEQAARKASEAEAEARAASRTPSAEPEEEPEEESAGVPEEISAAAEAPTQVLTEDAGEADFEEEDTEEDEFGNTDEIPVARVREKLKEQEADVMAAKTQVANAEDIARAVKEARRGKKVTAEEDSAFGENAFPVEEEAQKVLDTSFDSAFTDPQLNQEMDERKEDAEETPVIPAEELVDSAFGAEPEQPEEEIHSLQVAGDTITVNPVNAVNIHTVNADGPVQTTNPEAGINDPSEMSEFLSDNPVPKKEKKKMKKRDQIFAKKFDADAPKIEGGRFLWYNNQDIEALTKKEDMYYYCHYFDDPADAVLPLIIEMYDCAFVRTEEIQKIAYGINYKSMGLREILTSKEDVSFDRSKITKDPTEQDLLQIRAKWVDYVDNFLQIIVIKAPAHMQEYIREQLYAYGENDVETLLFCPEPEDEGEE